MKKKIVLAIALALCLALSACGSKSPSLEEVESAIRDGSVTIEDALDKGWITQEWADATIPAGRVRPLTLIKMASCPNFLFM